MFFDSWTGLLRVVVVGMLAYAMLVLMLRISGKRTLSKLSAFDLIVTIALGSTLATVLLTKDVALAEGAVAFALLIGMQFVVAWLSVRSARVRRLVKSEPRLLLLRGQILEGALREERVTEAELQAALRAQGKASLEQMEAVVLESDGSISVIGSGYSQPPSALRPLTGFGPRMKAEGEG